MPLFGGRRGPEDDARSREYVLTGESVVLADNHLVLVDAVVRYDQVQQSDGPGLGWDPSEEVAIDAVAVSSLRVEGGKLQRDEPTGVRPRLAEALERALAYAPVVAGFRSTLVSLEVRAHDPSARRSSEFRVLS